MTERVNLAVTAYSLHPDQRTGDRRRLPRHPLTRESDRLEAAAAPKKGILRRIVTTLLRVASRFAR